MGPAAADRVRLEQGRQARLHRAFTTARSRRTCSQVDEDFDGLTDRWEEYDPAGALTKVGLSRRHSGSPDLWITPGPGDLPALKEYDENGDMRVDRRELFRAGLIVKVEIDSDNDGKIDRWQDWSTGRLSSEGLDTNADGKPDRRVVYGDKGRVLRLDASAVSDPARGRAAGLRRRPPVRRAPPAGRGAARLRVGPPARLHSAPRREPLRRRASWAQGPLGAGPRRRGAAGAGHAPAAGLPRPGALQLVPLPPRVLEALSPGSLRFHAYSRWFPTRPGVRSA